MELIINGDPIEVPNKVETVSSLLQHYQLDQKVIIVERNHTILEKEEHQATVLQDGDKLELVHFVGGG